MVSSDTPERQVMDGLGRSYQGEVVNVCYMSLIVFGEWWGEYIYMYVVCTEERHHPYGIWANWHQL